MENKRPRLDDPAEFAIIKEMYFKENPPYFEDLDPLERLERQESKQKNKNKSSR